MQLQYSWKSTDGNRMTNGIANVIYFKVDYRTGTMDYAYVTEDNVRKDESRLLEIIVDFSLNK